jgi:hypothetical protein
MATGSTTSVLDSRFSLMRWLVPSVGDLLFAAILCLLVFTNLSGRLLGDAGIGWHIRTGQLILATHAIPRIDPFSSSMSRHPWYAWEWLYDVVVGRLESTMGLNGVVLLTALIIATVFSWTFRLLLRRGTNIFVALVLVLLAASASMIHFLARPHVVSWLFTLTWFWVLESSERDCADSHAQSSQIPSASGHHRLLYSLPLIMLVWVNMHGGFLLGFALLAIYWVSAASQWLKLTLRLTQDRFDDFLRKNRTGQRLRDLTVVSILSAAATLLNPYGFQLHVHIYRYLSNHFLMDHIDEFQSPNFHYVAQKCFAALLLLTLVALVAKGREFGKVSVSHGLVVLFAVYSGLYASRNIPVSSLLLILVIGPWLSDAMGQLAELAQTLPRWHGFASTQFLRGMETIELNLRGHLWPIAAIAFTCWVVTNGGNLGATTLMDAHFDRKRFPVAAVNYLQKQGVQGPLLSPDAWGGYLIYRLSPQAKVVIDDRHDFYGEEFLKSYLKMIHLQPGWEEFLEHQQPHCVIVPKDSALANILLETSAWKAIYTDDVALVFVPSPALLSR